MQLTDGRTAATWACGTCGSFVLAADAARLDDEIAELRSAPTWLRWAIIRQEVSPAQRPNPTAPREIKLSDVREPAAAGLRKRSVTERKDLVLRRIGDASEHAGSSQDIDCADWRTYETDGPRDLAGLLRLLNEQGLLFGNFGQGNKANSVRLTPTGWSAYDDLNRGLGGSQVFVAMSFDPTLNDVYDVGIEPVLVALGLRPMILRKKDHNNRIDAEIEAEIRRSALVIADVTQNKAGVYYEAGLARGWGIPVVWTVHEVEMANKTIHFDTRQFKHIVWSNPQDLAQQLKPHVENTLLIADRLKHTSAGGKGR
jgi:hypothetical protein